MRGEESWSRKRKKEEFKKKITRMMWEQVETRGFFARGFLRIEFILTLLWR